MILPPIDNDSDEEVNVDEDDVREIRQHVDKLHSSSEENIRDKPVSRDSIQFYSMEESGETDSISVWKNLGMNFLRWPMILWKTSL